jgi:MATE family multidrug resistance protein
MTELHDNKRFRGVGEVLMLAFPAAMGMLSGTVLQFIDALMIARLVGRQALSAQFVSAVLAFVPITLGMGLCTVINTFVSQNLGAGRLRRCGEYAWAGLYVALGYGALMLPLSALSGPLFAGIARVILWGGGELTRPAEMGLQAMYFRYLILGMPLLLGTRALGQFYFGTHRPWVVFGVAMVTMAVNVAANFVLILGLGPFEPMGLEGAAIGTVLGWATGLAVFAGLFLGSRSNRRYRTRRTAALQPALCGDILHIGWPAGLSLSLEVMAWSVFNSVLVAYFGQIHKAASGAVVRYLHMSFMPAIGVGVAATALVGRYIGAGRPDLARRRAHGALLLAVAYMSVCGLAFYLFRYPLVRLFATFPDIEGLTAAQQAAMEAEVIRVGATVMICAAVFQAFDAVGIVYIGALRGAGDTLIPMLITFGLSWAVNIGGGVLMMWLFPGLGSVGPWIAAASFVSLLGVVMAWRFESGAWRKIDLLSRPGEARPASA